MKQVIKHLKFTERKQWENIDVFLPKFLQNKILASYISAILCVKNALIESIFFKSSLGTV